MLLLFDNKVYKLNKNLTIITEICNFKIPGSLYNTFYKYWYINNNSELLININSNSNNNNIIIVNENGIIKNLRIECYYKDVLAVEKYNNEYYMLLKDKIIIIDSEFNIKEHKLLHEFKQLETDFCKKYHHFIFYNNNLFIAYYNETQLENDNSIITLNLLSINLKDNIFENKEISSLETIFSTLNDIVVYNNDNIIFCINDYDNLHKTNPTKIMLFNYDLNTNTLKYKNIKDDKLNNLNRIEKLDDKLIIFDHSIINNFIYLYNIKSLDFEKHLIINKKIVNGYYDILFIENTLIIRPYLIENKENNILYILNSNDITEKNIKLGALALKHKFKDILDIDHGINRDLKEYILEKMNCKVDLDENDNLINYKIHGNYIYNFIREIKV